MEDPVADGDARPVDSTPVPAPNAGATPPAKPFLARIFHDPEHALEVIAAILLAVTTVLTAWSAYQSKAWSGVQTAEYSRASSTRVQSTKEFNTGAEKYTLDTNTFNLFVAAYATGNMELADFYKTRVMRLEFIPYLDTWIASKPLDPASQGTTLRSPLEDPGYLDALFAKSTQLESEAGGHFQKAQDANETGNGYILATVFFASVLFFAGISSKFRAFNVRLALLGAGVVMLVFGLTRLAGLPIQ